MATIIRVLNYLFVHTAVRLMCVRVRSTPAEQSFLVILALLFFYMRCVCLCVCVKAYSVGTKSNEQHREDNVVTSSISLHLCLIRTSSAVQQKPFFFFFSPAEAGSSARSRYPGEILLVCVHDEEETPQRRRPL